MVIREGGKAGPGTTLHALDQRATRSDGAGATALLHVGLVMEEVVGHAVQAQHVRRFMADEAGVDSRYVPVRYRPAGDWTERVPALPHSLRAVHRARREVKAGLTGWRPDVILWNTQNPAVFSSEILSRTPSVITTDVTPVQYDAMAEAYGHQPDRPGPIASLKRMAVTRAFRSAKHVAPWTEWAARSIEVDYGVPRSRITVVPPGTDLERFRPDADKPSRTDGRVRILFVGGDFERKGGTELLQWFRTSPLSGSCILHLVTTADVEPCDNVFVHRLGYTDAALTQLYREADIFALPTTAECFGISLTEAAASGLPCVACPVGGVGEIVRHQENGYLVPVGDMSVLGRALEALILDEGRRVRLGMNGRALAEQRFDYRINGRRLLGLLRSAAGAQR